MKTVEDVGDGCWVTLLRVDYGLHVILRRIKYAMKFLRISSSLDLSFGSVRGTCKRDKRYKDGREELASNFYFSLQRDKGCAHFFVGNSYIQNVRSKINGTTMTVLVAKVSSIGELDSMFFIERE